MTTNDTPTPPAGDLVKRLRARLIPDAADPSDVVLWLGDDFAGNVGVRVQPVGQIFDVDRQIAEEMSRRWNAHEALAAERDALQARAEAAEAEADRYRYVLEGVRGAIKTGRNEPLMIWRDQIDIALEVQPLAVIAQAGKEKSE